MNQCPSCYERTDSLNIDRTGEAVCATCYVPTREELARRQRGTATEDVMVAPPNAKNVTPRWIDVEGGFGSDGGFAASVCAVWNGNR